MAVAKDASPWQKQALNKLDASSMETTRIREPQGPLVASSLRSERYSPGPLLLSNARSFLDSTSNLYVSSETVQFNVGDTMKTHTITINQDMICEDEATEFFYSSLSLDTSVYDQISLSLPQVRVNIDESEEAECSKEAYKLTCFPLAICFFLH